MRLLLLVVVVTACRGSDRPPDVDDRSHRVVASVHDAASPRIDAADDLTVEAGQADKAAQVRSLLARGPVLLHFDARLPGVKVPPRLATDPDLVLRFGYGLKPPITDMEITAGHIAGTLKIDGTLVWCVVPWAAVYGAIVDGENRAIEWRADAPRDPTHPPESSR
jgi:hypothetical protein